MKEPCQKSEDGEIKCRILDAAIGLFSTKGYAATSVREIVKAAGVTAPVLYYYFGSKEGLYLGIMNMAHNNFAELLVRIAAEPNTAREKLLRLAHGMQGLLRTDSRVGKLVYAAFYGPPESAPPFDFEEFRRGLDDAVRAMVAEGVGKGEFLPGEEDEMTWAVIGAINIVLEGEICAHGCPATDVGIEKVLKIVFRGMETR